MKASNIVLGTVAMVAGFALGACAPKSQSTPAAPEATEGAQAPAAPAAPTQASSTKVLPGRIEVTGVGLKTPESVLYDAKADIYLVSNVNGSPFVKDDNGFITKLSPDGKVIDLKWIDGKAGGFELDAPKGTAIHNGKLYVADIDTVRVFDADSGKHLQDISVPGSAFLNDVLAAPDGMVYVSDTGVGPGFKPVEGKAAVYRIDARNKVRVVAKGRAIGEPNGLMWDDGLWVADFGSSKVRMLDPNGRVVDEWGVPKGGLDGIVITDDGLVLVSSWEGKAVYERNGDEVTEPFSGLESPADIGLDTKRRRLLVPIFNGDEVVILALPKLK